MHSLLAIKPADVDVDLLPTLIQYLQHLPDWTPKLTRSSRIAFLSPPDPEGHRLNITLPRENYIEDETRILMASALTGLTLVEKRPVEAVTQSLRRLAFQARSGVSRDVSYNFNGATFSGPVTFGDPQRDVIGTQNNYQTDPVLHKEIKETLDKLAQAYSRVTDPVKAEVILEAEFEQIKQDPGHSLATLRRHLLDPRRHLEALRSAFLAFGNHFVEETPWGKAAMAYLDSISSREL